MTPAQDKYESQITIKPDAALNKAQFTSLELDVQNRGASVSHSWVSLDDPASFITVAQWVTK